MTKHPIREDRDSLRAAAAKLGGISLSEAHARGFDPADIRANPFGYGSPRVFTRRGLSFDGMAEQLSQYGYPVDDEAGPSPNVLEDQLRACLAIDAPPIYTNLGYWEAAERAALQAEKAEREERKARKLAGLPTGFFSVPARFNGRVVCRVSASGSVYAWRAPSANQRPSPRAVFLPASSEQAARRFALAAKAAGLSATYKPGTACACFRCGPLAAAAPAWATKVIIPAGYSAHDAKRMIRQAWNNAHQAAA
jgi:hypothetical protein